jgi:hypothetical protein
MIRKAYMTGALGLALLLAGTPSAARHRIAVSAQNFQQYFESFKAAGAGLGPVERLVFSLVLANTNPTPPAR